VKLNFGNTTHLQKGSKIKNRVFLSLILILLLPAFAADTMEVHSYRVVVNVNEELGPVNSLLFGQNYGPWMETSPEFIEAYRQARVTLLRFPAGNWGDENDITHEQLDELASLARALDAEVSIQTRLFPDASPETAASLVEYANIQNQYGFRYWEIGNEPDLYKDREEVGPDNPEFTPEWYSERYREFHDAMKAVDPSILIAGPVVTYAWDDWMPTFIYLNGDIIDILSWHFYGNADVLTEEEALVYAQEIEHQIETFRFWWQDPETNPTGYQRPIPPLFNSEYDVSAASTIFEPLGTQVASLWAAEVLGRMANSGVDMAAHFALQGTHWHGLMDEIDSPRPIYGLYQMYHHWGDIQIAATSSDETTLPAFASKQDDDTIVVMVINQDPEAVREVEVVLQGAHPAGTVHSWRLEEDGTLVDMQTDASGSSYTAELPPYTITLFVFDVVTPTRIYSNGIIFLMVVLAFLLFIVFRRRGRV
jgi:hypothetical protein